MAYSDDASDHSLPPMEIEYPDPDEVFHYPWQGSQQPAGEPSTASVIDPRLYKGLFPSDVPSELTGDADEYSSMLGEPTQDVADDSEASYEFSGEESST